MVHQLRLISPMWVMADTALADVSNSISISSIISSERSSLPASTLMLMRSCTSSLSQGASFTLP